MKMIYWTNTTFLLNLYVALVFLFVLVFFFSHWLLTFQLFLVNSFCLVPHTISYDFTSLRFTFGPFFFFFLSDFFACFLDKGILLNKNQMISMVLFIRLFFHMLGHQGRKISQSILNSLLLLILFVIFSFFLWFIVEILLSFYRWNFSKVNGPITEIIKPALRMNFSSSKSVSA